MGKRVRKREGWEKGGKFPSSTLDKGTLGARAGRDPPLPGVKLPLARSL